jgi:hypothetical protein
MSSTVDDFFVAVFVDPVGEINLTVGGFSGRTTYLKRGGLAV